MVFNFEDEDDIFCDWCGARVDHKRELEYVDGVGSVCGECLQSGELDCYLDDEELEVGFEPDDWEVH